MLRVYEEAHREARKARDARPSIDEVRALVRKCFHESLGGAFTHAANVHELALVIDALDAVSKTRGAEVKPTTKEPT